MGKTIVPDLGKQYIGTKLFNARFLVKENQKISEGTYDISSRIITEVISIQDDTTGTWKDKAICDDGVELIYNARTKPGTGIWYGMEEFKMNYWRVAIHFEGNPYGTAGESSATSEGIYFSDNTVKGLKEHMKEELRNTYLNEVQKLQADVIKLNHQIGEYKNQIDQITAKL